jgi:proteasome assembly chaperone (PAC2) family protein
MRKVRQKVNATVGSAAFVLWLGEKMGLAGAQLLESGWARILDSTAGEMVELALRAKQLGLIHARVGGGVVEIDASRLDDRDGQVDG